MPISEQQDGAPVSAAHAASDAGQAAAPHSRVIGLDAARALAILGMLAVNVGPLYDDGIAGLVMRLPHGRASLLFVLLAGIGYSFLTRRARDGAAPPWGQVLWRTVLLSLIGLSTQLAGHGAKVILTTYAVLFLVGLVVVRAPSWLLLTASIAATAAGPLVWLGVQLRTGEVFDREPATLLDAPGQIVASTFLTGPYPVITWLGPFLFGMWLGRLRLQDRCVQIRLTVAGVVLTLLAELGSRALEAFLGRPDGEPGVDWFLSAAAHSQMPLWLIRGSASAVAVLGLTLLVLPYLGRFGWPLVATGQLALTVYVVHLFGIAEVVRPGPGTAPAGLVTTAVMALVLIGAAVGWRHFFSRGPLEALLRVRLRRRR
ncbi:MULTISPECIES: heparan-alpha-glucosaminide N-acetyltransferase domain-containing protein [unclassified Pseudactinotalea]|uniref:heparan-alpha-glucosaminide N-acetyltransferase domain-containing protein n=1 Tax=unclassified Pseudactinotalea TaxID=2649176 RepID=UPI003C7A51C3